MFEFSPTSSIAFGKSLSPNLCLSQPANPAYESASHVPQEPSQISSEAFYSMFGIKRKRSVVHETTDSMKSMSYWVWEGKEKRTIWQCATYTQITSQFHTIARRIVGINIHGDPLPEMFFWREVETATVKDEDLACLWVYPLCCDHPPGTQAACFHLYLRDRGSDVSAAPAGVSSSDEESQTDETDEHETQCQNQDQSRVHVLCSPPAVPVVQGKRPLASIHNTACQGIKNP